MGWAGRIWQEMTMGLLDILNGMQNGPRGRSDSASGSGGMSPITMAILALLAYKAFQKINSPGAQAGDSATNPAPIPADTGGLGGMLGGLLGGGAQGGGLGDLLKGGLGGLLAGGAAGNVLSGGLGDLLNQLQEKGQGDAANSWVGTGPNKAISPNDLASALGSDQINAMMEQTGLSRSELLSGLAANLPEAVNRLTPDGRLPTEKEISSWL
jgi:uncharacterized protein YidB (DUF937 family)